MQTSIVYNIDCFEWLRNYNGEKISLVVTDPPYLIPNTNAGKNNIPDKVDWMKNLKSDTLTESYDIEEYAELLYKIQDGAINVYFFCNKLQIAKYFEVYVGKYKCKYDILCWHKNNALPTFNCKYLTDTEYILYFRNQGGCHPQNYNDAKTWFIQDINITDKKKYGHPTIKPLNIVQTLIRNSSNENDLICDTFVGSGTTRVAAYNEKRRFIGCELNKEFYDMQENRYLQECFGRYVADNGKTITQLGLF